MLWNLGGFHHNSVFFFHLFPSFSCQVFQFFSQLWCPFLLPSQARQRFRPHPICAWACIRPSAVVLLLPLTLRASGTNRAPGEAGCNHSDSSSPEQICLALGRGKKRLFKGEASSWLCIRRMKPGSLHYAFSTPHATLSTQIMQYSGVSVLLPLNTTSLLGLVWVLSTTVCPASVVTLPNGICFSSSFGCCDIKQQLKKLKKFVNFPVRKTVWERCSLNVFVHPRHKICYILENYLSY